MFNGCSVNQASAKESNTITPTHQEESVTYQKSLDEKVGTMLMVGFMGTSADKNSQICRDIYKYNLGGVILFDYNPVNHKQAKNIESKNQLARLTKQLQSCSRDGKLLIAVDQEGGRVQRLKSKYGFYGKFPKAKSVRYMADSKVANLYQKMAEELSSVGINYNLAPVVDLAINKKNRVIYKLGRSFGSNPADVIKYSNIFIDAMNQNGVLTSVKHFPGHGSSLGDTHKGFVDVTRLWQKKELEPYRVLNQQGKIDTVMVAHVFNKKLDTKYPATLSSKTINGLLRNQIGFDGVVITDDLQMGAISKKYGLKNTLKLAINAGDDILLFGNQLSVNSMVSTKKIVDTIKYLIQTGEIDISEIEKSNERIDRLKDRL
ncbi:MAG: glycosyl hydrolase [Epsilonproteobacteria bacterium]|nr:glycosyl hydrolase [Campylobacterota bacterium]